MVPIFNWDVFECDITHHRSVGVLCILNEIRCNPMHPIYAALPVPYVPDQVTRGALIAHRYTYAPTLCKTLQRGSHASVSSTFVPMPVSLWNDLADLSMTFDDIRWCGTGVF